jgi:hypothetical protein
LIEKLLSINKIRKLKNIKAEKLKKLMKILLKKEFPRSHKVRLYVIGEYKEIRQLLEFIDENNLMRG